MSFLTAFSGLATSIALGLNYGIREASLAAVATVLALAVTLGRGR